MGYKCVCRAVTDAQAREAKEEVKRDYGAQAFNKKAASADDEDLRELEREVHSRGNEEARENGFNCGRCRMAFRALICEDLDDDQEGHDTDTENGPGSDQSICCRGRPHNTPGSECRPD